MGHVSDLASAIDATQAGLFSTHDPHRAPLRGVSWVAAAVPAGFESEVAYTQFLSFENG